MPMRAPPPPPLLPPIIRSSALPPLPPFPPMRSIEALPLLPALPAVLPAPLPQSSPNAANGSSAKPASNAEAAGVGAAAGGAWKPPPPSRSTSGAGAGGGEDCGVPLPDLVPPLEGVGVAANPPSKSTSAATGAVRAGGAAGRGACGCVGAGGRAAAAWAALGASVRSGGEYSAPVRLPGAAAPLLAGPALLAGAPSPREARAARGGGGFGFAWNDRNCNDTLFHDVFSAAEPSNATACALTYSPRRVLTLRTRPREAGRDHRIARGGRRASWANVHASPRPTACETAGGQEGLGEGTARTSRGKQPDRRERP